MISQLVTPAAVSPGPAATTHLVCRRGCERPLRLELPAVLVILVGAAAVPGHAGHVGLRLHGCVAVFVRGTAVESTVGATEALEPSACATLRTHSVVDCYQDQNRCFRFVGGLSADGERSRASSSTCLLPTS